MRLMDLVAQAATQVLSVALAIALAPLLSGWVAQCRAWLANRHAPPLAQPYWRLRKLLRRQPTLPEGSSPLFRAAPYVVLGCMSAAAAIIPSIGAGLPLASVADAIALVGLFALARVFQALAAMDAGTAFASLGARREMMLGFLAEPALLMVLFTAAQFAGSTQLPALAQALHEHGPSIHPGLAFGAVAFVMVLLAENARLPVDNPSTHLELTMIHEAMVLEVSGRHLALIEWAQALKMYNYMCMGFAMFAPWGMAMPGEGAAWLLPALPALLLKLGLAGAGIALVETSSAKLRVFRAPEFLATAFLLAVLGLWVGLVLEP